VIFPDIVWFHLSIPCRGPRLVTCDGEADCMELPPRRCFACTSLLEQVPVYGRGHLEEALTRQRCCRVCGTAMATLIQRQLSVVCLRLRCLGCIIIWQRHLQWRLVTKISRGAAPENYIFFINWGWLLTLSLTIIVQV
jgi:hypothetical protein